MKRAMLLAVAMFTILGLAGCGGGGAGSAPAPNYAGLNPTITLTPTTVNLAPGGKQQFSTTITNSLYDTVTWEVNGIIGGNLIVGMIDMNGLYTAPAATPTPAQTTITAVLDAATGFSANSIVSVTPVVFANSALKGNYVLSLKGVRVNGSAYSPFYAVGAITADGNGNIIAGEEDLNDTASGYAHAAAVTGSYTIGADGRGMLNLNNSFGSFSYSIALQAQGNASLNKADDTVITATGTLEGQAAHVSTPSGNYAFGFAGGSSKCGSLNSIGMFGLNAGTVSGLQDLNCGGTITQNQALNGSYGNIDAQGRGAGSFSSATGASDIVYYVVSTNRYRFISSDNGRPLFGSADQQTKTSFVDSDFSGAYVIASSASSQSTGSNALIEINASAGNVNSGYIDINDTGTVNSTTLTGAYSLTPDGHIVGSFNTVFLLMNAYVNVTFPFSMYLISPTEAYYLDLRTQVPVQNDFEGITGGGIVYAEPAGVPDTVQWAGSYAIEVVGNLTANGIISQGNSTSMSGQISADGRGVLAGTLDNLTDPLFPELQAQGSYSVSTLVPGRTTIKITTTNGTHNYVGYVVTGGQAAILDTDKSVTALGGAILQF